ncbi:MAG: phosphopantetheine-binding protein [Pseudomonadota bacterium]
MSSKPITAEDQAPASTLSNEAALKRILADVLGITAEDAEALSPESGLFGHLPELDSMAVAGLLTEIEDRLDIVIDDDEVDGEMLETFGALLDFVNAKTAQA